MAIKKGDKVKIEYEGKLDDGTIFDSSKGREPIEFEVGAGHVIKGFEDAVLGMEIDEEKESRIEPADAYGEKNPKLIQKVPRDKFPKDKEIEVGMKLIIGTEKAKIPAEIIEVNDTEVTLDMNHPLAEKALNFKIKVISIE